MFMKFLSFGNIFIVLTIESFATATQPIDNDGNYDVNSKPFQERHRFESLLAAGRTLAIPFTSGLILSIISSQRENWNVSLQGLNEILDLSPDVLLTTYKDTTELIKKDVHVTSSSNLYLLQDWKGEPASMDALDKLQVTVKRVAWDDENSSSAWEFMNNNLKEATNNLLDGKLIPKDSALGNPFRFSTQALVVSTFHYKNSWKNLWISDGLQQFGNSNNNVPFLYLQGEFLHSDAEDYSAISVPLEGEQKSIVFIMPKVNLTQYLKHKKAFAGRVHPDQGEEGDFVPFPRVWEKRDLSIHIPSINLMATDQYGKELAELGMNMTFCTTLRDKSQTIPFYMRPIVQVNAISMTDRFVEFASASGTALEKFYFGIDLNGVGYPKLLQQTNPNSSNKLELHKPEQDLTEDVDPTTPPTPDTTIPSEEKFIFNRPFLWYLNDATLGPLVYGVVENNETASDDSHQAPEEESRFTEETQLYLMWSCRSFKQSGEIGENTSESMRA